MTSRTWPALDVGLWEVTSPNGLDQLQAAFLDYKVTAIDETSPHSLRVYFSNDAERDRASEDLSRQFPNLAMPPFDVPDENWVARSQAKLRAVRIRNIIVAPPWDIPHTSKLRLNLAAESGGAPLKRPVVIVIRPSMGFGTAHHATTRLCLESLQHVDMRGSSALDIGTGSGVLAIAMSQLGAESVMGIDDDPDALHSAQKNLALNRVTDVTLRGGDIRVMELGLFNLVTANLTGALLVKTAAQLHDLTAPGGRLIISGFMRDEEASVRASYSGLTVDNRSEEEGWVCVAMQRP